MNINFHYLYLKCFYLLTIWSFNYTHLCMVLIYVSSPGSSVCSEKLWWLLLLWKQRLIISGIVWYRMALVRNTWLYLANNGLPVLCLADVWLLVGHVEFRLHVCQHDIQKGALLPRPWQLRSGRPAFIWRAFMAVLNSLDAIGAIAIHSSSCLAPYGDITLWRLNLFRKT